MIDIKRTSTAHIALQYLKMKRTFISKYDLIEFIPKRFYRPYRAELCLQKLVKQGFAFEKDNCYAITEHGEQALKLIVKQQYIKFTER